MLQPQPGGCLAAPASGHCLGIKVYPVDCVTLRLLQSPVAFPTWQGQCSGRPRHWELCSTIVQQQSGSGGYRRHCRSASWQCMMPRSVGSFGPLQAAPGSRHLLASCNTIQHTPFHLSGVPSTCFAAQDSPCAPAPRDSMPFTAGPASLCCMTMHITGCTGNHSRSICELHDDARRWLQTQSQHFSPHT